MSDLPRLASVVVVPPVAQWIEQEPSKLEVAGSNPAGRTKCGCSSMEEQQISNLMMKVRFPSSAPQYKEVKNEME